MMREMLAKMLRVRVPVVVMVLGCFEAEPVPASCIWLVWRTRLWGSQACLWASPPRTPTRESSPNFRGVGVAIQGGGQFATPPPKWSLRNGVLLSP